MAKWLTSFEDLLEDKEIIKLKDIEKTGKDPAKYLLSKGLISLDDLLLRLSNHYDLPSISLGLYEPQREAIKKISEDIARRFNIFPLFILKKQIFIAVSNPDDLMVQDFIRQMTGLMTGLVIATREDINNAINRYYLTQKKEEDFKKELLPQKESKEIIEREITIEDEEAPTIKTVNHIFTSAIHLGASDIHLEPFVNKLLLRYRVDGVLHEFNPPPFHMARSLVSRIKILSNMDIAEKRLPQDGRSSYKVDDKEYDLRVSIIPNMFGESIVIRILDKEGAGKDLDEIDFPSNVLKLYKSMIRKPYGIILITGPTGSGKSTTLYSTLKEIYTLEKKIITLEDPVEYQLEGITQFAVNADIGFTFAAGLRSILRHDPNIVMLGEIRDLESAEIAIRASLTGHLLFSTLHTNDAPSAVTRLIDMGIQSYLVMSSLLGVMAQRLVRKLCNECKKLIVPDSLSLSSIGIEKLPKDAKVYKAVGCPSCNNLGYKGRMAIFELLEITPEMRRLSQEDLVPDKLREIGKKYSFNSLRENALNKWLSGATSIEEIVRLTV